MKASSLLLAAAIGISGLMTAASAAPVSYVASLSGAAESPANASPGTGTARVAIDTIAHTLDVQLSFSGLTGTTTAAHIHGPVAAPGNAGVITTLPTFPDFPLGVTSGTYSRSLDTLALDTYNASFVTSNGGTAASAEAVLALALENGNAYLNIHTQLFPGGEIRGFFAPTPVPVPAAALMSLTALAALGGLRLRRMR